MSQSPNDDFYNSSTEMTELPPQEDFPPQEVIQQYGVRQQNFPQQNPSSLPGFGQPNPQAFSPAPKQNPSSLPGFGQPNPPQGPVRQPGFEQPNGVRSMGPQYPRPYDGPPQRVNDQASFGQQRPPNFPPPSGPISQPGFSSAGQPQQDRYPAPPPPRPSDNPQSGGTLAAWEQQQSNGPARQPQQPGVSPWGQPQPNDLANWPTIIQPQTPAKPKRSMLMLMVALIALVLLILGSGTFVLLSRKSNTTGSLTPLPTTTISNRGTPVATHPVNAPTTSTGAFNSINAPVQAGNDWIATITSVKTTTASLIAPNPGNTYLELHLTLKNTSGKTLTVISIIEFTLTDASGHRYNETATDTNIRRPPDGNINANQTLAAQLAYEVPTSQHTFVLTFAYGLSSNDGSSVAWRFTA